MVSELSGLLSKISFGFLVLLLLVLEKEKTIRLLNNRSA